MRTSVAGPGDTIIGTLMIARAELEHKPTTENLHAYNLAAVKAVADINAIAEARPNVTRLEAAGAVDVIRMNHPIAGWKLSQREAEDQILALMEGKT